MSGRAVGAAVLVALLVGGAAALVGSGGPDEPTVDPTSEPLLSAPLRERPDRGWNELATPPEDHLNEAMAQISAHCGVASQVHGACRGDICALVYSSPSTVWGDLQWASRHPRLAAENQARAYLNMPPEATPCGRAWLGYWDLIYLHRMAAIEVEDGVRDRTCSVLATGGAGQWSAEYAHPAVERGAALCDELIGVTLFSEAFEAQGIQVVQAVRHLPIGHIVERSDLELRPLHQDLLRSVLHYTDPEEVVGYVVVRHPIRAGTLVSPFRTEPPGPTGGRGTLGSPQLRLR